MTKIDQVMIRGKLEELKDHLEKLEEFRSLNIEKFSADHHNYALAVHYLQQSLEVVLDISRRLVISLELKTPDDSHSLFPLLQKAGVLTEKFATRNSKLPGFRNRLVHLYETIDHTKTYEYLQEHFDDLNKFIKQVSKFLLKQ